MVRRRSVCHRSLGQLLLRAQLFKVGGVSIDEVLARLTRTVIDQVEILKTTRLTTGLSIITNR